MMKQEEFELGDVSLQEPEMLARLEAFFRYAQVGNCVNGVTHDVNNFLGAIMAYAELVAMDEGLGEQSRKMLENVQNSVRRSSALLGQLTAIARPALHTTTVLDLQDVLRTALEIRDYDFKMAQIHTRLDFEENIPSICGEAARLQLCFDYLLRNAYEALLPQENREISMAAARRSEAIRIVVWNSGPNIPVELHENMFQPYVTTKSGDHLGLGLYSARQIVRDHGGDLRYEAAEGFVVEIPQTTPFQS